MKLTGEYLTFNAVVSQTVVNGFAQVAVSTGLFPGGNEGLLVRGLQFELLTSLTAGTRREVALSRASKTVMPTIDDDDVIAKYNKVYFFTTSGAVDIDMAPFIELPPQQIVVVESNMYFSVKTISEPVLQTYRMLLWVEAVELTDKEKNAILSSRLNNLLN